MKQRNHERHIGSEFNLSAGDYATILAYQGGKCYVCGVATGAKRALAVDHDHVTGLVRAVLCGRCNFELLGRYDVPALRRAIEVFVDPPAPKALGRAVFVPGFGAEEGM